MTKEQKVAQFREMHKTIRLYGDAICEVFNAREGNTHAHSYLSKRLIDLINDYADELNSRQSDELPTADEVIEVVMKKNE